MLCLGKILENPESNVAWEQKLGWIKSSHNYRNFDRIDGEPMELEWNIFHGFNTLQFNEEVTRLLFRVDETPENFTGRILFMPRFNDISCGTENNERRMSGKRQIPISVREKIRERTMVNYWSLFWEKWYSVSEYSQQGIWYNIAERTLLEFAESGCPNFTQIHRHYKFLVDLI